MRQQSQKQALYKATVTSKSSHYISGKTKIKIKEHFAETKVTALDLVESAIKYENRTKLAG